MGYLVCDKCGGYYELKNNENHENFIKKCACGGKLHYKTSIVNKEPTIEIPSIKLTYERKILFYGILAIIFLSILFRMIVFSSDESSLELFLILFGFMVPLWVAYKVPSKAIKYGIILAVLFVVIDKLLIDLHLIQMGLFGTSNERYAAAFLSNSDDFSFLPSLYDLIVTGILFVFISWVGKTVHRILNK